MAHTLCRGTTETDYKCRRCGTLEVTHSSVRLTACALLTGAAWQAKGLRSTRAPRATRRAPQRHQSPGRPAARRPRSPRPPASRTARGRRARAASPPAAPGRRSAAPPAPAPRRLTGMGRGLGPRVPAPQTLRTSRGRGGLATLPRAPPTRKAPGWAASLAARSGASRFFASGSARSETRVLLLVDLPGPQRSLALRHCCHELGL